MKLRILVRDALHLTWALPAEALPELPRPLRYETHRWEGRSFVFVSVLLSRQEGLRVPLLPLLSLAHPQLNLFTYVLDGGGEPAIFLHDILVPGWLAPGMRILTGLPVSAAGFDVPRSSAIASEASWQWRVRSNGQLDVEARRGGPRIGEGPRFPSWEAMIRSLTGRGATYIVGSEGLRRLELHTAGRSAVPAVAEVGEESLLKRLLAVASEVPWPRPYAAWLDSELPVVLALGRQREVAFPHRLPAPG